MTFSDSFRSVLLGSRKMNSENLGTEIYSVNYIINNAEYTVTDTHEVHSRLQSGKDKFV